jgi:hypothetical protein
MNEVIFVAACFSWIQHRLEIAVRQFVRGLLSAQLPAIGAEQGGIEVGLSDMHEAARHGQSPFSQQMWRCL